MTKFPRKGSSTEWIERQLRDARRGDADWRSGRMAAHVHFARDDILEVARDAFNMFFCENASAVDAFPSVRRMEEDLVSMSLDLCSAPPGAGGVVTGGGTESIFLAMAAARALLAPRVLARGGVPECVVPVSAHPAFEKAAGYLGLRLRHVELGADFCADAGRMREALGDDTIVVVGSAPSFPYGTVDPIREIAAAAAERGVWMHVDACNGGYLLPFLRDGDTLLPPFDFALPGVNSISIDVHKYGFAPKGVSSILYRDGAHARLHRFESDIWKRGRYSTPGFAGSRPAGSIAAAWAVIHYLGREGYGELARRVVGVRTRLEEALGALGLHLVGRPQLGVAAFTAPGMDARALVDALHDEGWHVGRLDHPPALHLMLTPAQEPVVDIFAADVASALGLCKVTNVHAEAEHTTL